VTVPDCDEDIGFCDSKTILVLSVPCQWCILAELRLSAEGSRHSNFLCRVVHGLSSQ